MINIHENTSVIWVLIYSTRALQKVLSFTRWGSGCLFVCCWLLVDFGLGVGVDMVGMFVQLDMDDASDCQLYRLL